MGIEIEFIVVVLIILLLVILLAPLFSRRVEENLEIFFFVMGVLSATVTRSWSLALVEEALLSPLMIKGVPIGIFQVVLIASILFAYFSREIDLFVERVQRKISLSLLLSLLILVLGIGSSLISVIVASVIISEIALHIRLPRDVLRRSLIVAAYAVGLGAALTPVGEPLSTIAIHKLSGEPYHADFFFLLRVLGEYIIALIILYSIYIYLYTRRAIRNMRVSSVRESVSIPATDLTESSAISTRSVKEIIRISITRALKIYIFIFALVLIGASYEILVDLYLKYLPSWGMYLFGTISAVVDNATLTAAIISPELNLLQIKSFLISLLISGGFLIPGNVPNIVIANIHKIRFGEWAREAIPLGLPAYLGMFILFFVIGL
ncbi:MAG: DUF1646 family protein [Sulfolobales archaeon]